MKRRGFLTGIFAAAFAKFRGPQLAASVGTIGALGTFGDAFFDDLMNPEVVLAAHRQNGRLMESLINCERAAMREYGFDVSQALETLQSRPFTAQLTGPSQFYYDLDNLPPGHA